MRYHLDESAKKAGCTFRSPQRGDAGYDIASAENIVLYPGDQRLIETGLRVKIPRGHVGIIKDRSGFSSRNDAHVFAGVIDERYHGPKDYVKVLLKNLNKFQTYVMAGQYIAQMIVVPIYAMEAIEDTLDDSLGWGEDRGGFGSTDKVANLFDWNFAETSVEDLFELNAEEKLLLAKKMRAPGFTEVTEEED